MDASRWREVIAEPGAWARSLRDLAQALPYLDPGDAQSVVGDLVGHPSRRHEVHGPHWVDGVFRAGGPGTHAALQAYARDAGAPSSCRQRAAALSDELDAEGRARTAARATQVSSSSPLAFESVGAEHMQLSPADLADAIAEMRPASHRRGLTDAGIAPLVAVDLDGTMWDGDIGDDFFKLAIDRELLHEEARAPLARLCARFGLSSEGTASALARELMESFESGGLHRRGHEMGLAHRETTQLYYECNTWCFAGHSVAQLKTWARELFEGGGFRRLIFSGAEELLSRLRRQGMIPCAVSASGQWLVEVGTEYLGIPPWRSHGVRTKVEGGRVSHELQPPVTYGPGKLATIRANYGGRPAIAMGDSVEDTDREMLLGACLAIVVQPSAGPQDGFVEQMQGRDPARWRALRF